jgi:hypothetical protein
LLEKCNGYATNFSKIGQNQQMHNLEGKLPEIGILKKKYRDSGIETTSDDGK